MLIIIGVIIVFIIVINLILLLFYIDKMCRLFCTIITNLFNLFVLFYDIHVHLNEYSPPGNIDLRSYL